MLTLQVEKKKTADDLQMNMAFQKLAKVVFDEKTIQIHVDKLKPCEVGPTVLFYEEFFLKYFEEKQQYEKCILIKNIIDRCKDKQKLIK